jgi:hypothetical protein
LEEERFPVYGCKFDEWSRMRTITVSPGEEIRIVCEDATTNKKNNKSNNKGGNNNKGNNNKGNNKRANLNYNNSNADDMDYLENNNNSNNNNAPANDEELEDIEEVTVGGKRARKTRKISKKGRKGTQKGGKKRGPNGYMKFSAEMRPKIIKEYPELKSDVVGVARKIGEAWRKMSDAEKKKY